MTTFDDLFLFIFLIKRKILFNRYLQPQDSRLSPYWSRRSTQAGTNAIISTASVLVILGLINFLAVRDAIRVDLTENHRLVVFGTSQFAANGWFDQQLNGDVFLNAVSWLTQSDADTLSIRPKPATNRRLAMTPSLGRSLSWFALFILPLFGFFMAAMVWWRRR